MKNIEDYRKRFITLSESIIGNVKTILNEDDVANAFYLSVSEAPGYLIGYSWSDIIIEEGKSPVVKIKKLDEFTSKDGKYVQTPNSIINLGVTAADGLMFVSWNPSTQTFEDNQVMLLRQGGGGNPTYYQTTPVGTGDGFEKLKSSFLQKVSGGGAQNKTEDGKTEGAGGNTVDLSTGGGCKAKIRAELGGLKEFKDSEGNSFKLISIVNPKVINTATADDPESNQACFEQDYYEKNLKTFLYLDGEFDDRGRGYVYDGNGNAVKNLYISNEEYVISKLSAPQEKTQPKSSNEQPKQDTKTNQGTQTNTQTNTNQGTKTNTNQGTQTNTQTNTNQGTQINTGGVQLSQSAKINTTNDKSFDYALDNGKYYFKGKGTQASKYPNWVEAKGNGLNSIKSKVKF